MRADSASYLLAAAGDPDIVEEKKKGKHLGNRTYKIHLDGYNQRREPALAERLAYYVSNNALGLNAGGTVKQIEILDYRETYGSQDSVQLHESRAMKPGCPSRHERGTNPDVS